MMMANCVDFGWQPSATRFHLIFAWITREINCFGISTTVKDAQDIENALLITRKLKSSNIKKVSTNQAYLVELNIIDRAAQKKSAAVIVKYMEMA